MKAGFTLLLPVAVSLWLGIWRPEIRRRGSCAEWCCVWRRLARIVSGERAAAGPCKTNTNTTPLRPADIRKPPKLEAYLELDAECRQQLN